MGMLHPHISEKLDFVVAFSTGKFVRRPGKSTARMPLDHQTYICGRTYKVQSTDIAS
jgi:hypothetical protein